MQDQEVAAGLVIPEGYGAALEAGEPAVLPFVRIETSSGAQSVYQAVQGAVAGLNAETLAADDGSRAGEPGDRGVPRSTTYATQPPARAAALLAVPAVTTVLTDSRAWPPRN